MQMKNISMMLMAGCVIAMLTGCGIPKEEHNAILAEMNEKYVSMEASLNAQIDELEAKLTGEEAKSRAAEIELEGANEKLDNLKTKAAELTQSLTAANDKIGGLESTLSSTKSALNSARSTIADLEAKLSALKDAYANLEQRLEMYKKNFGTIKPVAAPADAAAAVVVEEEAPAPVSEDIEKVSSLLDAMGNM